MSEAQEIETRLFHLSLKEQGASAERARLRAVCSPERLEEIAVRLSIIAGSHALINLAAALREPEQKEPDHA